MKHILLALVTLVCLQSHAQLGGIVNEVIRSGGSRDMKGEKLLNFGISYPISLKTASGNGSVVLPMTHVGFEYGIWNNITLGALIGYGKTKTSNSLTESLLGVDENSICSLFPDLCGGTNISTATSQISLSSTYLGLSFAYHFNQSEKLDLYLGATGGLKIVNQKISNSTATANEQTTILNQLKDDAGKVFYTAVTGGRYYIKPKFAIRVEAGYGYGYGDDIAIGLQTVILTLGGTYNFGKNTSATPSK